MEKKSENENSVLYSWGWNGFGQLGKYEIDSF